MKPILILFLSISSLCFAQTKISGNYFPFIYKEKKIRLLELYCSNSNCYPDKLKIFLFKRDTVIFVGREIEIDEVNSSTQKDTTGIFVSLRSIVWESTLSIERTKSVIDDELIRLANDYFEDFILNGSYQLNAIDFRDRLIEVEYKKMFLRNVYRRKVIGSIR